MNFAAGVLTFREGLEAALVVAIMLGYLRKSGRIHGRMSVWAGVISASALAVLFTVVLQIVGAQFEDPAKGIYEGTTSLLAVAMLTYMIFWMSRQARHMKGSLEQSMTASFANGATWGLFGVAFLTVAREGVETALFLSASAFESSGIATLLGGIAGLVVAVGVAWAIYVAGIRLNLRTFFKVTSILLVIFGAGILRYGLHEFEDVGWLPPLVDQLWNTGSWIPSGSTLGAILQALVGYTSTPSLLQLAGYCIYLVVVVYLLLRPIPSTSLAPAPATANGPSSPGMVEPPPPGSPDKGTQTQLPV